LLGHEKPRLRDFVRLAALGLGGALWAGANAWADAAGPTADKSQYTLLDPVPGDLLRDMDTDRPNFTNTPHTIDAGHLQIETGLVDATHFHDRTRGGDSSTDALTLGHVNVRLGVLDDLEINAAIDSYGRLTSTDHVSGQSTRRDGFGDAVIGGKLNIWGKDGGDNAWATALAIQPQIKLPTAHGALGNGHVEEAIGAPFLVNLVDGFHLGLETAASRERNRANTGYVAGWQNSASVDRLILGNLDIYLEDALHATNETHAQPTQSIDIGFTYPVRDNLVIDSGAFVGVNRATPQLEWTSGVSIRF
jgi:hypothetical protein